MVNCNKLQVVTSSLKKSVMASSCIEESHRRRIFLRRLSGSELGSTSFLLGNGSSNESRSRLVLRPLSVQERIRELNLRARHFAETVMAVQLHDTVSVGKIV